MTLTSTLRCLLKSHKHLSRAALALSRTIQRDLPGGVIGSPYFAWSRTLATCTHLKQNTHTATDADKDAQLTLDTLKTNQQPYVLHQEPSIREEHDTYEKQQEQPLLLSSDGIFAEEIISALCPSGKSVILDLTFGSGVHTRRILESDPAVKVIAVDRDPATKHLAEELKATFPGRLCFMNIKFSQVVDVLLSLHVPPLSLDGAVIDPGPSHAQLTRHGGNARLDLRMDGPKSAEVSAKDVLRHIDDESLYRVLKIYGQTKYAKKIALALLQARYEMQDIRTATDLNNFIMTILGKEPDFSMEELEDTTMETPLNEGGSEPESPGGGEQEEDSQVMRRQRLHSYAAGTFQALRMLINNELNELDFGIKCAHHFLRPEAPLAVVTYNKLEDTIIKRHFTGMNIDTSVSTIGRPIHRYVKLVGMSQHDECKPWHDCSKTLLAPHWGDVVPHPHWRHAKLRTAIKNANVAYDRMEPAS